jgi:hypothetical protein
MSTKTRINWLIDAVVLIGALTACLSGVYFLFVTSGGYQSGQNAFYGLRVLFERETWDALHTWGGDLMIVAATIHFFYHWSWVVQMTGKMLKGVRTGKIALSSGGKFNVFIDIVLALSFFIAAMTGVYFLLLTSGGYEGGRNPDWDPGFLFSRPVWDAVHTWSGTIMIIAAIVHFAIHWRWVKKVTMRFFATLVPAWQS